MKVIVGSDHRGIEQRMAIVDAIKICGHEAIDHGTHSTDSVDYPDIVAPVARSVASAQSDRGILICGTGIGVSIAANKIHGVRAAVCHDERTAKLSRQHNNASVLCMPADTLSGEQMGEIIKIWLSEEFEGGRHERRVNKIHDLELRPQET